MRAGTKGIQISLIAHGIIFAFLFYFGGFVVSEKKPLLIDFSVEEPVAATHEEDATRQAAARKVQAPPQQPVQQSPPAAKTAVHETVVKTTAALPAPAIESQPRPSQETAAPATSAKAAPSSGAPLTASATGAVGSAPTAAKGGPEQGSESGGREAESPQNRYLKEHYAYIKDLIMKGIGYPLMARKMGWEGRVTVSFVVCENGSVEKISIKEPSGHGILDKNAVETIKKVCPLPRPPARAELVIPIIYKLE